MDTDLDNSCNGNYNGDDDDEVIYQGTCSLGLNMEVEKTNGTCEGTKADLRLTIAFAHSGTATVMSASKSSLMDSASDEEPSPPKLANVQYSRRWATCKCQ